MAPSPRNAHAVVAMGTQLFIFGGHSGNSHLRDCHVFDTESITWTSPNVSGFTPPGLRGFTATLVGTKFFLFGGYDGRRRTNDLYVLNTDGMKWSHNPAGEKTPAGRQRHSAT